VTAEPNRESLAARRVASLRPQTDAIFAGGGSRLEKMRRMRAAGATLQSIGDCFGITREGVRKIIDTRRVDRTTKIGSIINAWNRMPLRSRARQARAERAPVLPQAVPRARRRAEGRSDPPMKKNYPHYLHTNADGLMRLRPAVLVGNMMLPQFANTRQRALVVMSAGPFDYYAAFIPFDAEGHCGLIDRVAWQPSEEVLDQVMRDVQPKIRFADPETHCRRCGKEHLRARPALALVRADGDGVR